MVEPDPARASQDRRSLTDPEVLSRLSGTCATGPVEIVVAVQGDHVLTMAAPGAVTRLVAQPLGIFLPKPLA